MVIISGVPIFRLFTVHCQLVSCFGFNCSFRQYFSFCQTVSQREGEKKRIDGWMTWDFTSFSIVFQSYQDDGQMIMKGCAQWNLVYG